MSYRERTYYEKNGEKIYGETLPVIYHNRGEYYLQHLTVVKDGIISGGKLKDLEQIKSEVKSGRIRQNIPDNVELECDLGIIKSSKFTPEKNEEDLIKEIEDLINEMNNRETRYTICKDSYKNYLIEPSESNFEDLKDKYDDLPSHQKVMFAYIEVKDPLWGLMNGKGPHTLEERTYILKDYFKFEL